MSKRRLRVTYTIHVTDEIEEGIRQHYGLPADIPKRELDTYIRSFYRGNGDHAIDDVLAFDELWDE